MRKRNVLFIALLLLAVSLVIEATPVQNNGYEPPGTTKTISITPTEGIILSYVTMPSIARTNYATVQEVAQTSKAELVNFSNINLHYPAAINTVKEISMQTYYMKCFRNYKGYSMAN